MTHLIPRWTPKRRGEPVSRDFHAVESPNRMVRKAQSTADESLKRLKADPKPHKTSNPAFLALFDTHRQDRKRYSRPCLNTTARARRVARARRCMRPQTSIT